MKPSVHVAAVFPLAALPSVSLHVFGVQQFASLVSHGSDAQSASAVARES